MHSAFGVARKRPRHDGHAHLRGGSRPGRALLRGRARLDASVRHARVVPVHGVLRAVGGRWSTGRSPARARRANRRLRGRSPGDGSLARSRRGQRSRSMDGVRADRDDPRAWHRARGARRGDRLPPLLAAVLARSSLVGNRRRVPARRGQYPHADARRRRSVCDRSRLERAAHAGRGRAIAGRAWRCPRLCRRLRRRAHGARRRAQSGVGWFAPRPTYAAIVVRAVDGLVADGCALPRREARLSSRLRGLRRRDRHAGSPVHGSASIAARPRIVGISDCRRPRHRRSQRSRSAPRCRPRARGRAARHRRSRARGRRDARRVGHLADRAVAVARGCPAGPGHRSRVRARGFRAAADGSGGGRHGDAAGRWQGEADARYHVVVRSSHPPPWHVALRRRARLGSGGRMGRKHGGLERAGLGGRPRGLDSHT